MQIREYEGIVGKRVKDIIDKCVGVDVEDHTQGVGIQLGEQREHSEEPPLVKR